MIGPLFKQTNY